MSHEHDEIDDNEIRIIRPQAMRKSDKPMSSCSYNMPGSFSLSTVDEDKALREDLPRPALPAPQRKKSSGSRLVILLVAALGVVALLCFYMCSREEAPLQVVQVERPAGVHVADLVQAVDEEVTGPMYVSARDTVAGGVALRILTAEGATPQLVIGSEALDDSAAVLVAQAADVRADNGQIAGAFVMKGDLLSRGEAKAGFCAIVNGQITVGVADATPMLEKAIESEGYFFRQFPLVVGGQIVENKPRGTSLRKALAEIDGRISVILSLDRLTFHEFSQALVDAGVTNAVYLVGSTAPGFYVDEQGTRFTFGKESANDKEWKNINYIVWK